MIDRVCSLIKMQKPLRNRGLLFSSGATVPVDGTDNYQTGCIFQHTDGTDDTSLYVNEGSVTSCDFNPVSIAAAGEMAQIEFDDGLTGPLISISTDDPTDDSYTTPFLITGTYSSTCALALQLSATNARPVSFLFDDGGEALGAGDYRATLSRVLLCETQTNAVTLNALRGQVKMLDLVMIDSANSVVAPITGYLELAGTSGRVLNGNVACVRAALEEGASGATTVNTYLAGFEATLNSTRTYDGTGLTAAYVASIHGGTSTWQYGVYVADSSCDNGVSIGATTGAALQVSGASGSGFNTAMVLVAADQAGTALALGAVADSVCVRRTDVSAQITGGNYLMGHYMSLATSGAFAADFIMGNYVKITLAHVGYETYAQRGRVSVTAAQTGDQANQIIGVAGHVDVCTGSHALTATGGIYGVQGLVDVVAAGDCDQPIVGGYFKCNPVSAITGLSYASLHHMIGECDWAIGALSQTSVGQGFILCRCEDSAYVDHALKLEVAAGSGKIRHLFSIEDAQNCCANTSGNVGAAQASDAIIKIDIGGTNYYLAAFLDGSVTGEWAD